MVQNTYPSVWISSVKLPFDRFIYICNDSTVDQSTASNGCFLHLLEKHNALRFPFSPSSASSLLKIFRNIGEFGARNILQTIGQHNAIPFSTVQNNSIQLNIIQFNVATCLFPYQMPSGEQLLYQTDKSSHWRFSLKKLFLNALQHSQ